MADITRTQIIVVGNVETNAYGDLTFTDKEGKSYKVKSTRKQYSEKAIVPGQAAQLNFAVYMNKEYVYSAEAVKDKLPEAVKPGSVILLEKHFTTENSSTSTGGIAPLKVNQGEPLSKEPAPQAVGMTTKEIGDMIRAKMLTEVFGKETAIKLLAWYKGQVLSTTKISESHLVDEARKLGATEVEP